MTAPPPDWDCAYRQSEPAPWDIGRPQPAFAALAEQGRLTGDVLDAGCGSGEHAVLLASRGAHVTGIDVSETAIRRAGEKAAQRGVVVSFRAGDILTARLPPRGFDTVIDSGLFHVFSDTDRVRYVAVLGRVLRPGGACFLMCFSDRQPGDWGPRRVARGELEAAFSDGWIIESVQPAAFDTNPAIGATTAQAWLAVIRRTEADANLRRPKRR